MAVDTRTPQGFVWTAPTLPCLLMIPASSILQFYGQLYGMLYM
jgi:hypothetical protein